MNPLGDKVRAERLRLRESVRTTATRGGISNTWWARFEDGTQPLTDGIVDAVAKAFGWPKDWPTSQPVDGQPDELHTLIGLVRELSGRLAQLQAQVAELAVLAAPPPKRQAPPRAAQSKRDSS